MDIYKVETTLQKDGTLTLTELPFHAGDSVKVILVPRTKRPEGNPYPLRGKVIKYDRPFDPVAEEDWEVLK